ncbi:MAG: serine protease [Cyanobacteria bacterium J083]|nr:MAG: serine protease [Cyanobacteria bacterium J083]
MFFQRHLLPSCILGTAAIVSVVSPSLAQNALLPTEVAKIAKATVVRIEPTVASPGSGVIIGRKRKGRYYEYRVLTARHVVQYSDDEYYLITPRPISSVNGKRRRQKIKISDKRIERLKDADLAIITFKSNRRFDVATLGDSDHTTEGAGVYIGGFPNPGQTIRKRIFQFTASLVSSRLDLDDEYAVEGEEIEPIKGGYALVYTNVTRAGMSGGPVFDVAGRVIGIHGLGDGDRILGVDNTTSSTETGPATNVVKSGFNLGIPIRTFLSLKKDILRDGVAFDDSEPGRLLGDSLVATRGGKKQPKMNLVEEESMDDVELMDEASLIEENNNNQPIDNRLKPQPNPMPNNSRPGGFF